MINYLNGKVINCEPTHLIMDINGMGYEVKISLNTYSEVKSMDLAKIHTHLHVKEDSHTLFGFFEIAEKARFLDLISISGVGPSTALMVLSSLTPEELQTAISQGDALTIQGVKGIGAKTAQRIVLELKDKVKKEDLLDRATGISLSNGNTLKNEALSALTTLGISKPAAEKSINFLLKEHGELPLEELIKLALKRA